MQIIGLDDLANPSNHGSLSGYTSPDDEESKELPTIAKKAPCLGCPIEVDISNPENLESLQNLLKLPLAAVDSSSSYKYSKPNILSAKKQVIIIIVSVFLCIRYLFQK